MALTRPIRHDVVASLPVWALDNGCFTNVFTEQLWKKRLESYWELRNSCAFVVAPDVLGNHQLTLKRFWEYLPTIREFGYPVALATQDGLIPDMVPWNNINALFIGGTDEHKRGSEGGALITEGLRQGKWVHVARINSGSTLINHFWMVKSWDGTTLIRHPMQNYNSIGRAVRLARKMQEQEKLL